MMRKSNFIIIEVLACFLLLVYLLYTSVSQNGTEKENIQETEKMDMQKEQVSIVETGQGENEILTDEMDENTENLKNALPVRKENPNPYFFPEDAMTVIYNCSMRNSPDEKNPKQIKMSVCRERAFQEGILYSLEVEDEESVPKDDADIQEKLNLKQWLFYVREDKIYLIRDLEIRQDITEEDLLEAGTVICQSESKAEDPHTRNTFGPHEMLKAADGKCAFYGYYDDQKTDNIREYYEHFIWQSGKGLIAYRSGHNETEDIALCMDGVEKVGFEDENVFNPYFFPEDKTIIEYEGEFYLDKMLPEKESFPKKMEVKLSVEKEKVLKNGILYRMDILNNDKFYFDDSEAGKRGKKRMHLGYFYVQADKIYLIRDMEVDSDITEEELIEYGEIICQPEAKGDIIDPEEKGMGELVL